MSAPNEDHAHHLSHDTSAGGGPPHRDVPPPLQPKGVSPGGGARPSIRRHQQLPPPEPLLPPPPPPHEPLAGAEVPPPPSDPRHPAAAADLRSKRSHYNHKALLEIRRSLVPFAYAGQSRSEKPSRQQLLQHLSRLGHDERQLLRMTGLPTLDELLQRIDVSCSSPVGSSSGTGSPRPMAAATTHRGNTSSPPIIGGHLVRKQSFEYDLAYNRVSPALESSNASTRSESPGGAPALPPRLPTELCRQYPAAFSGDPPPPPLPPPRSQQQSPQLPSAVQQRLRRMSPVSVPSRVAAQQPNYVNVATGGGGASQPRGASPMIVQNGPAARQQLTHQMQALCLDPPPYPHLTAGTPPPPSYSTALSQTRQSPTQSQHDYSRLSARQSPSVSPISCSSTGSSTPVSGLHSYPAFQAKAHSPIIMQSVKSTHVQKPVLQTAVAPTPPVFAGGKPSVQPPTYSESVQGRKPALPDPQPAGEPPTYQETLAASRRVSGLAADLTAADELDVSNTPLASITNAIMTGDLPAPQPLDADDKLEEAPPLPPQRAPAALPRKPLPPLPTATARCDSPGSSSHGPSPVSFVTTSEDTGYSSTGVPSLRGAPPPPPLPPSPAGAEPPSDAEYKMTHQSPIPERRRVSREREAERSDGKVKLYSPQAFKFFMEQHVENLQKSCEQRQQRRRQLESEMSKSSMPDQARNQIRRMLYQKESNFIRLKRAKMNRRMFKKLRVIGVGAFGEVSLVRKIDTNHLYAMKTLRKTDVLKRNQVAHVKAERDILAEAENEWVVKLYYSFQDRDFLYFVMDYIPGGDLMSLLIKFGIFEERLARFYIVELTCALEYVHKMGFIHRDIKPDNVLIDRDGHIKLTDFGLCTGFRWTHNSKYYTSNEHVRQDSMELVDDVNECRCSNRLHAGNKPLERRRRREHQRCEAHSLVGTPNYIAPEVLMRTGYTQLCDWWSVGVILYEMLVGQPPFLASTPAETQLRVINWAGSLKIPKQTPMSAESRDLISRLLTGADRRIGSSAAEVKMHPFFAGIDFDHVRRTPAPYVPKIRHDADTSNFDAVDGLPQPRSGESDSDSGGADGPTDAAARSGGGGCELPDHPGFFEFTFRRFFDGHVSPSPHKPVDDPVYV